MIGTDSDLQRTFARVAEKRCFTDRSEGTSDFRLAILESVAYIGGLPMPVVSHG